MPQLPFSQAMTANQRALNPITTKAWAFEYPPWPAYVRIIVNATTAGVQMTVKTGSTEIQPASPVMAGGTAGVLPAPLNASVLEFVAMPGDRLAVLFDEVLGGTPTVNLIILIDPAT